VSGKNPTTPTSKFVGSEVQRSRAIRSFLAGLLRRLRQDVPVQATEEKGHLSAWIFSMHGISQDVETPHKYTTRRYDETALRQLVEWMGKVFSPYLNPRMIERAKAQSEEVQKETVGSLRQIPNPYAKDLNSILPQKAARLLDVWGIPREFYSVDDISVTTVRQQLRSLRALLACFQINKIHVLTLIAQAAKGQRQAVLDLVKVDRMFLHDPCTDAVIRQAEMLNERYFLDQLTRAQEYRFKPKMRALHHLYLHLLFMIERFGVPVPPMHELWRILDPHAREYKSLQSLERDVERRRIDFDQMVADAEKELRGK
jgi:hypothetical protein